MRKVKQGEYLRQGELYTRDYNTKVIATIPKPFRYKELTSNKDMAQWAKGNMFTSSGSRIETVSELEFQRGDKVVLFKGANQVEITNIELVPYQEYGILRGINRYKKVITLT